MESAHDYSDGIAKTPIVIDNVNLFKHMNRKLIIGIRNHQSWFWW
jgi:hypothetical protein